MHLDARGLPISTASGKAAAAYDFLVILPYPAGRYTSPSYRPFGDADPECRAWLLAHSSIARFAMKGPRCAATW